VTRDADGETGTDAATVRARLRDGLTSAMRARDREAVSALRTTLAALDNAEAVAVTGESEAVESVHVAGARAGVGAAEAGRRALSPAEVRGVVQSHVTERTVEADRYDAHGQPEVARRLRREADVLRPYVAD
jgi:uncharacterized protein